MPRRVCAGGRGGEDDNTLHLLNYLSCHHTLSLAGASAAAATKLIVGSPRQQAPSPRGAMPINQSGGSANRLGFPALAGTESVCVGGGGAPSLQPCFLSWAFTDTCQAPLVTRELGLTPTPSLWFLLTGGACVSHFPNLKPRPASWGYLVGLYMCSVERHPLCELVTWNRKQVGGQPWLQGGGGERAACGFHFCFCQTL